MLQNAIVVKEAVTRQEQRPISENTRTVSEIRRSLGLEDRFNAERFTKEAEVGREEAVKRFKEKYKSLRVGGEEDNLTAEERRARYEETWQKNWNNLMKYDWRNNQLVKAREEAVTLLTSKGITNIDETLHWLELDKFGSCKMTTTTDYYSNNERLVYSDTDIKAVRTFYEEILENPQSIEICKALESNPLGIKRLLEIYQRNSWNLSKYYSTLLPRLNSISEENYQKGLKEMQPYSFLLPKASLANNHEAQSDLVLRVLEKGEIDQKDRQILDNIRKIHEIMMNCGNGNDALHFFDDKYEPELLEERTEDELVFLQALVFELDRNPRTYVDQSSEHNPLAYFYRGKRSERHMLDIFGDLKHLEQEGLLHPLAIILKKGFRLGGDDNYRQNIYDYLMTGRDPNGYNPSINYIGQLTPLANGLDKLLSSDTCNITEAIYGMTLATNLLSIENFQKDGDIQLFGKVYDVVAKAYQDPAERLKHLKSLYSSFSGGKSGIDDFNLSAILKIIPEESFSENEKLFWDIWETVRYKAEILRCDTWSGLVKTIITDGMEFNQIPFGEKLLSMLPEIEQLFWKEWQNLDDQSRGYIRRNLEDVDIIDEKTIRSIKLLSRLISRINKTSSKEIRKLRKPIIGQLILAENPEAKLEEVISVFEKNNLPEVGKIYRVFEILHPQATLEEILRTNNKLSPVLREAGNRRRYDIIYRDLLKVHIESGNSSLYRYLQILKSGQALIDKVEFQGIEILSKDIELPQLMRFLSRMDTLLENSLYGRKNRYSSQRPEDLLVRIRELKKSYGIGDGESLTARVTKMFAAPLGYSSLDEVLEIMDKVKANASRRNTDLIKNGTNNLTSKGDLLKGINSEFIDLILQNGSVAKEFLGADAGSDYTPLDTDLSMILERDGTNITHIVNESAAKNYGDVILLFKNRGQFDEAHEGKGEKYNPEKYELFFSGVVGNRHYGVRTGIGSTQIDIIINKKLDNKGLERLFFSIAQNGFYIPVIDEEGKILFTLEMYEEHRITKDSVKGYLEGEDKSGTALMNALKKSPYIKTLFESGVGVWEGYTLEEHTKMVLNQYEKYFSGKWKSPFLNEDDFRILLGLHDIGKPLAVKMTGDTHNQHEYTMRYLPRILEGLGIDVRQADVITALVSGDYLGQYFQGKVGLEETGRLINMKAKEAGVSVDQFFELLKMYYACDAGSYTKDTGGKQSLDQLFIFNPQNHSLSFSDSLQQQIAELHPYIFIE